MNRRLSRRAVWLSAAVAAVVLAAGCSSASTPSPSEMMKRVPKTWSPAAAAKLEGLAGRLQPSPVAGCTDYALTEPSVYAATFVTLQKATVVPRAVGTCTAENENLELVLFKDSKQRDTFIEERRTLICRVAAQKKVKFPGLRFAVGKDWSVQPDSQAVAIDLARQMKGTYRLAACDGIKQPDWNAAALDRIGGVATRLTDAGYRCDFEPSDRDLLRALPHYQQIGLAGALGACKSAFTALGSPTTALIGFTKGADEEKTFLPKEFEYTCKSLPNLRVVRGDGWAVFVSGQAAAEAAAKALGATVDPRTCPPAATSTTTAPTTTTTKP
jgi:hypothetical protein